MRRALPCLLLLVVAGCGAAKTAPPAVQHPPPSKFAGSAVEPPAKAPGFALRDQDGKLVRLADQRGKLAVVAFLYTRCPDTCPLIASNLNTALRRLGPQRKSARVLAISVDPKNDTPAAVRRFVRQHRLVPQFRYLSGTKAQLAPVWKAYHIAVVPNAAGSTVGHSSYEVLVDRDGAERVLYDAQVSAEDVLHDIAVVERN